MPMVERTVSGRIEGGGGTQITLTPICFKCDKGVEFTIRGMCNECAPELHHFFRSEMEMVGFEMELFKQVTGTSAFENWYRFEVFQEMLSHELCATFRDW